MLPNPSDFPKEPNVPRNLISFGFFGVRPLTTSAKMAATCSPCNPASCPLGDNVSSTHSPSGQLAGLQGEQVAAILADVVNGRTPKKPKEIKLRGTLGSLGKSDGFGSMFQQSLTGLVPRLTKSGILWLQKRH